MNVLIFHISPLLLLRAAARSLIRWMHFSQIRSIRLLPLVTGRYISEPTANVCSHPPRHLCCFLILHLHHNCLPYSDDNPTRPSERTVTNLYIRISSSDAVSELNRPTFAAVSVGNRHRSHRHGREYAAGSPRVVYPVCPRRPRQVVYSISMCLLWLNV